MKAEGIVFDQIDTHTEETQLLELGRNGGGVFDVSGRVISDGSAGR